LVDEHLAPRDDARKIEQALNQLLDSAFGDYVDTGVPVRLTQKSLEEYLGPSRQSQGIRPGSIDPVEIGRLKIPVQESALLTAHAAKRPGTKWKLQLPLALGDKDGRSNTLADTARIAWEVALASVLKRFPTLTPGTVYLHVDNNDARPDLHGLGFAGFGMTASLVSAMLGKPLPPQTTLGGAVDLKGNVLPLDVNEQGLLERKILRAAGEGNQTFYLPAGETTRQQLETTMRRHALLRGILIENGTAELTLVGAPGPMDSSDLSETGKRKKEEADLWNRTLESLPAKAKLAGIETSNGKIPFDQFQEFQESGPDSAPPQIDTITLKGSEEDLIKFITDNEALRSTPLSRYVLVHTVDEALTNLFPTTTEDTPSPPHENGVGSTLKSLAFGVATALTLMGTVAPSPAPAAPLIEPPHLEASPFFSGSITSPNQTLAAIGVLGQNEHPGSPLNLLARHVEETPAATLTPTLVDQVADQMSALPSPRTDSDTSQPEWGEAWGMVSNFINRRPRRVISAASRNKTDRTSARTKDYYASLGMALRTPANKRHLVLVDWGMVVSRPEEVEKLLSRMSENRNQTPEIAFLDSEGTAKQMEEDLSQAGLGQWATSHLVDRTGLEQAGALSATGQVDLTKVEAFLQTVLQKRGRSPAPLTQVVVDPINARRYLGEVVQLLMDVNEVVLQGTPAIQFLKTLGHDTTHPIRTPTMAYDPHTRTLRLQAQSIGPSALTNFGKTLLLIDSQA
jgi:hypothetical protein